MTNNNNSARSVGFALDALQKAQQWAGRLVQSGFGVKIEEKPYTGFCTEASGRKTEVFGQPCIVVTQVSQ